MKSCRSSSWLSFFNKHSVCKEIQKKQNKTSNKLEIYWLSLLQLPSLQTATEGVVWKVRLEACKYRDERVCNAGWGWDVAHYIPFLQLLTCRANFSTPTQCQVSQHCIHSHLAVLKGRRHQLKLKSKNMTPCPCHTKIPFHHNAHRNHLCKLHYRYLPVKNLVKSNQGCLLMNFSYLYPKQCFPFEGYSSCNVKNI